MSLQLRLGGCLIAATLLAGAGCCPKPPVCPDPSTIIPLETLVGQYNANARKIGRIWAKARVDVNLKGRGFSLDGAVFLAKSPDDGYQAAHDFVLIGRESGQEVFRAGSSLAESVYYFWYKAGQEAQGWWGRQQYAGAPGLEGIPIDANQLLAALAVTELPSDFTRLPTVALSMSSNPCAYVLTFLDRQPLSGRIVMRREIYFTWSANEPPRAFMVNLFGPDGRRIVTATLKDYKPIRQTGDNTATAPAVMPSDVRISWPQEKTEIHLLLQEMSDKKVAASSFNFENHLPGSLELRQVDRELKMGASAQ